MQVVSVEWLGQMFGGPIFRGWNEILLLGKGLKFGLIFQNICIILIEPLVGYTDL